MISESGSKGLASTHFVTHDVQGGSLQCGPKGFAHAVAEDADVLRAQAITEQIIPFAGQVALSGPKGLAVQENNGSQHGGNTPTFSASQRLQLPLPMARRLASASP